MDEEKFAKVVDACSLRDDFDRMPNGANTEIGEHGANLSGGQKQRISLARALYTVDERDIFLLDDPLSAADSKVAAHIFNKAILEFLKGKTVVLVTHGGQFLEKCDKVAFLYKGALSEYGKHEELMEKVGDYVKMQSYNKTHPHNGEELHENHKSVKDVQYLPDPGEILQFIKEEKNAKSQGIGVSLKYLKVNNDHYYVAAYLELKNFSPSIEIATNGCVMFSQKSLIFH